MPQSDLRILAGRLLQVGLGVVYLGAALAKIITPVGLNNAFAFALTGASQSALGMLTGAVIAVEFALGAALLMTPGSKRALIGVLAHLAVMSFGYSRIRAEGFLGDCGCSTVIDTLVGSNVLLRNGILASLSIVALLLIFGRWQIRRVLPKARR